MNSTPSVDTSQQRAAKVAGLTFLLAITIIVITNYSVSFRFIVPGNAVETATNLLANVTLFRLNVVGDLLYLFNLIIDNQYRLSIASLKADMLPGFIQTNLLVRGWKIELERRTLCSISDFNPAVMVLNNFPDDGQPQSGTAFAHDFC